MLCWTPESGRASRKHRTLYQHIAVEEQSPVAVPGSRRSARLGIVSRIASALSSNRKAVAGFLILLFFVAVALFAPLVAPYNPSAEIFTPLALPSHDHFLGTTSYGQDIFSQLVWGSRQTLMLGLIGGLAATVISVLVGVT